MPLELRNQCKTTLDYLSYDLSPGIIRGIVSFTFGRFEAQEQTQARLLNLLSLFCSPNNFPPPASFLPRGFSDVQILRYTCHIVKCHGHRLECATLAKFDVPELPRQLADDGEQLSLKNKLALLVLFGGLVGLVVLPADSLAAPSAHNVPHDVAPRGHVPFGGLGKADVHDDVEEVGLTMLAAEVLCAHKEMGQLPALL